MRVFILLKTALAINYELSITAREISSTKIELIIKTNIPLPVEVMTGVDLAGQKRKDIYIGYSERIRLELPTTVHVLDTAKSDKSLPSGQYEAVVSFYKRWGAKKGNPDARSVPDMEASSPISLGGDGTSAENEHARRQAQKWVIENVPMQHPWNEAFFVDRLGHYKMYKATLSHLHDAYYFPDADMTLIVNRLKQEVTIWRFGRAYK